MPDKSTISFLETLISSELNIAIQSLTYSPVSGGSINQAYQLIINQKEKFFCKINSISKFPLLFEKEKNGLELLASQHILRTPAVIVHDTYEDRQVLVLEWIEPGLKTNQSWKNFGKQLAQLHQQCWTENDQPVFGLKEDNYMGALPQSNTASGNWIEFFIEQRLQPQCKLAMDKGLLNKTHLQQFEKLYAHLPGIFAATTSSLLHGDLWSGNFLIDTKEQPVLIDPAVYYGHAAMDLAMTTLFGGFEQAFYEAYHYYHPLPHNHRQQWDVCNLYPLLIHLNLFGSGYRNSIELVLKGY